MFNPYTNINNEQKLERGTNKTFGKQNMVILYSWLNCHGHIYFNNIGRTATY